MSIDGSDDGARRRKELARQLRREAYQKEKERRAADPRVLAMKEAARESRRALYAQMKERRKAALAEDKAKRKVEEARQKAEERATMDGELMKLLTWATKGSNALN